jgi:hypothetical protein
VEILISALLPYYSLRTIGELFPRITGWLKWMSGISKNICSLCVAILFTLVITMFFKPNKSIAAADLGQQIPIFDDGTDIRVPVTVFGETRYFLLDTGFTVSAMDRQYKPQLGEAVSQYRVSTPLDANEAMPIYLCPEITIGGRQAELDKISCLDLTLARLISGQPCDGVLGMDFFAKNVVSIDFDKKVLSMSAKVPATVEGSSIVIPLTPLFQHYAVEVLINKTKNLDLLIDTGDNSSVSLNSKDWQDVFSNDQTNVFTATIAGINNQVVQSKIGRIELFAIQGRGYTNLHAAFIRNLSDPSHLGLNFFRRHKVTFDFANQKLYLQPGRQFAMVDKEDMSGLHLLRRDGETFVYSVDNNSPAFAAGIGANDVIMSVDGRVASSMTMNEIRNVLQSKDGEKINFEIRRGENRLQFGIILKKKI